MSKSKKNGRVELLRFLFAMVILLFHIQKRFADEWISVWDDNVYFFNHGNIGVEFFFLVSGFLLAAGCYSKREVPTDMMGTETAKVMFKKIANIFPYHLFAIMATIAVNAYFLCETAAERWEYLIDSWASVFFVQIFGFESTWVNKLTWYLDVWLVGTLILYYFLRKHYDVFVKIVCPLMALFILGYLDHEYQSLGGIDEWTGIFYKAFLRGLAEMELGCSAYSLTRELNRHSFTRAGHVALGLVELACYIVAFGYSCSGEESKYQFLILFVMCLGVILTFSNVNPGHKIFDHQIFTWLGKMSLLIYLNQFAVIRTVQELLPDAGFVVRAVLCVAGTFALSFVCDWIVGFFLKKKYLSRLFIEG